MQEKDKWLEKLYEQYYDQLLRKGCDLLGDWYMAEDAVNDVIWIACGKYDQIRNMPFIKAWLYATLKNTVKNMQKNHIAAHETVSEWEDMTSREDEYNLDVLYGNLKDNPDYILLKKYALEHYRVSELAEEQGITVEACKKRLQRARKNLQKEIKKDL
ncbi:MAG: sigma-70 family RNA polymerase sigma factor [Firmicutes bacterium]|nr:sigma-70 family RNA polymerase sigma factor [Bacillota bacterium]